MINIKTFDLNLLLVFDALIKEGNVTRAGAVIGLSQPSMSNALTRLRKLCNDPLFVRTRDGMQPTTLAQQLAGPVQSGLEMIRTGLGQPFGFDPSRSNRVFRLIMSDIAVVSTLPSLMARLEQSAPGIDLKVLLTERTQYRGMLESGSADLAVGHIPELKGGFYQQRLFEDNYVCLVRESHPVIRSNLKLKQYAAASHILVSTSVGDTIVDREMGKLGHQRRIALEVPHFLVVTMIVRKSDLVATIPSAVLTHLPNMEGIRVLKAPLELPSANVRQFWHKRCHQDPQVIWLRRQVAELFKSADAHSE